MLISGFHAVTARLRQSPGSIRELYVVQGREDTRVRDLVQAAERAGVEP
ncbi:MAG: RNA methyltransferase substrate-binding domain-containing protein, partial [Burkholderiales bacterium]